jgi:hypothetical protein
MKKSFLTLSAMAAFALSGCATANIESKDYSAFQRARPQSILVVPVINHSNEVDATNLFFSTLAVPLAERGYYVFPSNAVRGLMEAEGLGDAGLVHETPAQQLAPIFGADAVLYVEVIDWQSKYEVISSSIQTEFLYTLKSGVTGEVLWQDQERVVYSTSANSGNILANLLVNAVTAAINNTRSDFTPLAIQANVAVLSPQGQGIPFGARSPNVNLNGELFPATGSGRITDATTVAVSAPDLELPAPES